MDTARRVNVLRAAEGLPVKTQNRYYTDKGQHYKPIQVKTLIKLKL